jgi:hypothetical protein
MAEEDSNINNVNPVNGCASTQQERGSHSYRQLHQTVSLTLQKLKNLIVKISVGGRNMSTPSSTCIQLLMPSLNQTIF